MKVKHLFSVGLVALTLLVSNQASAGCRVVWEGIHSYLKCDPLPPTQPSRIPDPLVDIYLFNNTGTDLQYNFSCKDGSFGTYVVRNNDRHHFECYGFGNFRIQTGMQVIEYRLNHGAYEFNWDPHHRGVGAWNLAPR